MVAAEKIEWWGEHPAVLWSLHPGDALWDASGFIEWQGDYPALFWNEHPCDLLWDESERASLSPANDNCRHLIPLATAFSQQPGGVATHESATFPHARAANGEMSALGARAHRREAKAPRASPRQGEAQPAQARVGFLDIPVSSFRSAEQAGGWGLPQQKSAVSKKYMPFFWNGSDPMAFDYSTQPTTPYGRQRYDAFGRQVQTFDLDGTITLQSRYHALSSDLWDAADLTPGPHQGSYASECKDGHGRTIQTTERFREGGAMELRHVRSTYHITGEPTSITRVRGGTADSVTRWMQYDSLGRMVLNVEPNTTSGFVIPTDLEHPQAELDYGAIEAWRYQYNFAGDLIATSDARSCGQNFYYDSAGRILGEDYAPCEPHHAVYSQPTNARDADNLEVTYYYDDPDTVPTSVKPSLWTGSSSGQSFTLGRAIAVLDRGSASFTTFDGRGRTTKTQTRIAKPVGYHDNAGVERKDETPDAADRYAPRVYEKNFAYDAADREISSTTGTAELKSSGGTPLVPELLSSDQTSAVTTSYTRRGTVKKAGSSYGSLITSIQRTADNLVTELRYGDAADTRTAYLYDERRRVSSVQTYRGPPASGAWDALNPNTSTVTEEEPTRQLVLQDEDYIYDVVGNPVEIRDWRDAADWPDGAKPVTKKIEYDDLYRATRIKYEYADGDDTWKSPFQAEVEATATDPRQADPTPHIQFQKRILEQTFQYDWLGNNARTGDDAAGFYDRSLGTVTENTATGKRYQLKSASNSGVLGADGQDRSGSLEARYDDAGNKTQMGLLRNGTCLGGVGTDACSQQFIYDWDEVGRLTRARRWDNQIGSVDTFDPALANTPEADLRHTYDASDQRVIKEAVDQLGNESYTLYVFESLELRRTQFGAGFAEDGTSEDYEVNHYTVVPYLLANGVRLARLVYHAQGAVPEEAYDSTGSPGDVSGPATSKLHVFFELGDHLGSTSVVLDKATGELVERSTFQGYGGAESDYRPGRWANFREDYRFTGKEEDVEVGLQYFGKRYLNPLLGRWISADPLAVHVVGADLNLYAYVSGQVLRAVDPLGLEGKGTAQVNFVPDDVRAEAKAAGIDPENVPAGQVFAFKDERTGMILIYAKDSPDALSRSEYEAKFLTGESPPSDDGGECTGIGCSGGGKLKESDVTDAVERTRGVLEGNGIGTEDGKKDGTTDGKCPTCDGSDAKQALNSSRSLFERALSWAKNLYRGFKAWRASRKGKKVADAAEDLAHCPPGGCGRPDGFCFLEGTLVLLSDGSAKPIETIEVGDIVAGADPTNVDEHGSYEVTRVYRSQTGRVVTISVQSGSGAPLLVLESTGEHPFWVTNTGWVTADDLTPGDELVGSNGEVLVVEGVAIESRQVPTYNLSVAGVHTYFVGNSIGFVLVHNQNIDLGDGYSGRVDQFETNGRSAFEIHVYDGKGKEVGVHGHREWIPKHGHKAAPELPPNVANRLKGRVIQEHRRRGYLPDKGKADITGDKWKDMVDDCP